MGTPHHKKHRNATTYADDFPEKPDFREVDAEFQTYRKRVVAAVVMAGGPVSIPDLHRRLGADARREWTMDALMGANFVLHIPKYPLDLFAYEPNIRVVQGMTVADGNALPFIGNKKKRLWNGGKHAGKVAA